MCGGVGGGAQVRARTAGPATSASEAKPRRRSATGVDGEVDEGAAEYPGADVVSTAVEVSLAAPAQQFPPSSTNKTAHETRITRGS